MSERLKSTSASSPVPSSFNSIRHNYRIGGLTPTVIAAFRGLICEHYRTSKREFPWRRTRDPYHILVSEIMLQQTQVPRVEIIFPRFVRLFPDFSALAGASLEEILDAWSGLGYNRRALVLRKIAQLVIWDHNNSLPRDPAILVTFPGIGPATAGSIAAFAFNEPVIFLETNIRTVYMSLFFPDAQKVHDKEILPLVERTCIRESPRAWYSALMDYGAMLKKRGDRHGRMSGSYRIQSRYEGSDRQVRSNILKILLRHSECSTEDLMDMTGVPEARFHRILLALEKEGFICTDHRTVKFPENE